MRKLSLLLVLLVFATGAQAQNSTTVTTTVTDNGGIAWVNGTFEFDFVGPPSVTWPGGSFNRTVTGTLDGTAFLSQSLPSNATITPSPTFWSLKVCPLIGIQQACFIKQFTISGATQPLTVTPPALSLSAGSLPTAAYADAEFAAPVPLGFIYFQALTSTTGTYRQCQGLTGSACTTWGNVAASGGSPSFSAITSGTNTSAAMVVGTGASLTTSGTGTITSNQGAGGFVFNPTDASDGICTNTCASLRNAQDSGIGLIATDGLNVVAIAADSGTLAGSFGAFIEVDSFVNNPNAQAFTFTAVPQIGGNTTGGLCFQSPSDPPCATGFFSQPSDTRGDAFNGQDLTGFASEAVLQKASGNVRDVTGFAALTPVGFGVSAIAETSTNTWGIRIMDQGGFSTTEQAPIRIDPQTTPGSGSKFSIDDAAGAGVASFGDGVVAANVTDSALTSGRCVQSGAAGILTNAAGACGSFSSITSGTNTTAAMIVGTGASLASVPEFDIGAVGTSGVLGLLGTTSGKATFTAPAVAGTVTNPVTMSNTLTGPAGTNAAPTYSLGAGIGIYISKGTLAFAGLDTFNVDQAWYDNGRFAVIDTGAFEFVDNDPGFPNTVLSRPSAGVLSADTTSIGNGLGKYKGAAYTTTTICAANGTAANPSVASCGSAAAGMFSCATAATTGTCQVNTTAVTANSEIQIIDDAADGGASQLNVTCNTALTTPAAKPLLLSKSAGVNFIINLGTVSVNPACFEYTITN